MIGAIPRRSLLATSLEATVDIARQLGGQLRGGETIALEGDLGAGKTAFTRGLCLGVGLNDARIVSSPTYVLEHVYPTRIPVHHYDAYRLASAAEFAALGGEERRRAGAILVIEWAEKVAAVLPADRLIVAFAIPPGESGRNQRFLHFFGPGDVWGERLLSLIPLPATHP